MKIFLVVALFLVSAYRTTLLAQTIPIESLSGAQIIRLNFKILDSEINKDSVTIMFQAFDDMGNFITGMAQRGMEHKYFKSLIDKEKKEICKDFTVFQSSEKDSPGLFNFSIVLDYSGSMEKDYPVMQRAAQQFINGLSNSKFSRVNFDNMIYPIEPTPTRNPKSVQKDRFSDYGGETALFAAADAGVKTLKNSAGSRFVILFTDGIDNASAGVASHASSPSELINSARAEKAAIYALGFGVGSYQRLSTICELTGGEFHNANDDLIGAFHRLQTMTFSNFYIIKAKCSKIPESVVISTADGKETVAIPIIASSLYASIPPDPEYLPQFGSIQFSTGSTDINKKYEKTIDQLIQQMVPYFKSNQNAKIEIRGHASPDGEESQNTLLSFNRARTAFNQVCNAISAKYPKDSDALNTMNQISFKGYGEKEPIYPVDSRNNPENRRVEIVLIK